MGGVSSDSTLGSVLCAAWFVISPKISHKQYNAEASLHIEQQGNTCDTVLPYRMTLNIWHINCCMLCYYSVLCVVLVK